MSQFKVGDKVRIKGYQDFYNEDGLILDILPWGSATVQALTGRFKGTRLWTNLENLEHIIEEAKPVNKSEIENLVRWVGTEYERNHDANDDYASGYCDALEGVMFQLGYSLKTAPVWVKGEDE